MREIPTTCIQIKGDPFFGGMTYDEDDDDDDDEEDADIGHPFGRPPGFNFGFSFGPGRDPMADVFGFEEFFRDFNELFADFGSMTRVVPELPGADPPLRRPEGFGAKSLRDFMLKSPDSHLPRSPSTQAPPRLPRATPWGRYSWDGGEVEIPQGGAKQDRDLDSEVSSRGLDTILRPSEPRASSFFQSVSVSKLVRPDGTIEERRTVRDSQGNTSTTVTVQRGDEILSSETREGPQGPNVGDHVRRPSDPRSPPDLSDSQTVLSRILQRWFSQR
ncbi:hypothetical protein XENTR_v10022783 [Xenopus tropicalis]|uniref:HCLS1 associated protein X-1 n=1 Tax=Xenopus tropicalis TaxID=8364 RepID=A0A803J9R2_XENTR|nr:HCLS1-associated protein X-1 isoform X2 [Xenopus tropicalis]KAE8588860.1 hypothetical protein XENTR_v10022783 [Xenopus tropicalis]